MRSNRVLKRTLRYALLMILSSFAGRLINAQTPQSTVEPNFTASRSHLTVREKCAPCHADIVASYAQTSMAQASGTALQALIPGEFTHPASHVHYRIFEEAGKAWLSFDRDTDDSLQGKRELLYFIGSGQRGRTYLFSDDGYVFESPVNWYAQSNNWDMTPAYRDASRVPLNLPAAVSCLHCHTSGFR